MLDHWWQFDRSRLPTRSPGSPSLPANVLAMRWCGTGCVVDCVKYAAKRPFAQGLTWWCRLAPLLPRLPSGRCARRSSPSLAVPSSLGANLPLSPVPAWWRIERRRHLAHQAISAHTVEGVAPGVSLYTVLFAVRRRGHWKIRHPAGWCAHHLAHLPLQSLFGRWI